jgi:hypothetical protein
MGLSKKRRIREDRGEGSRRKRRGEGEGAENRRMITCSRWSLVEIGIRARRMRRKKENREGN